MELTHLNGFLLILEVGGVFDKSSKTNMQKSVYKGITNLKNGKDIIKKTGLYHICFYKI